MQNVSEIDDIEVDSVLGRQLDFSNLKMDITFPEEKG